MNPLRRSRASSAQTCDEMRIPAAPDILGTSEIGDRTLWTSQIFAKER